MESNQNSTNMATQNIESNINFKTIIGRFLGYLPYFIISLVLAISIAYLVNRYTPIKYSVKAQFLIKDKGNRGGLDGMEGFLQGMQLINTSKNVENEIGLMKSRIMIEETIKNCDFNITYYGLGKIKNQDLYPNQPFVVLIDSNHAQSYDIYYKIKFTTLESIEIEIEPKDPKVLCLIPSSNQILNVPLLGHKNTYKTNQIIETANFRFKILITNPELINL
jgi:hypothetical protein